MLEAKSLPCTHWGVGFGGRPVLRTCTLTIPESKAVMGAEGSAPIGAGEVSTVELSIRWAPEIRLRSALSLVAVAGGCTRRLLPCKVTVLRLMGKEQIASEACAVQLNSI